MYEREKEWLMNDGREEEEMYYKIMEEEERSVINSNRNSPNDQS